MEFVTVEGVKMVPGTLHIVDLEGTMNVKHQKGGKSDIVLVPQPSNDPNDPLNWSKFRKEYHFWLLWIWGFLAAVCVNWVGPVWTQFTIDLKTTYFELSIASAFCFLFLGLGCVILQPIAMKIGRRPIYLVGSLLNFVGCIVGRFQTTIEMQWATNILTGFGAAPVDSLVQITTTDIFFAHEKGTRLSLYVFTIYAGSYLGPVAAGHIADSQNWRWCYQYLIIFFAVLLVIQIFTMEESTFRRPLTSSEISGDTAAISHHARQNLQDVKIKSEASHGEEGDTSEESAPPAPKTYWQRMGLYNTAYSDPRPLWLVAISPFMLVTYPAVMWAGFIYGVQIMWLSLLNVTQSELFSGPPYNFSVANVGNINFSSFIGGILGMFWGGYVSDWCIIFLSRRNKGILEPEFRLWTMLVPAIINTAGILMYGLGVLKGTMWLLPAGFGMVFIAFGIGSGGAIAITYAVDCYPRIASESLVLMLFIRNMIGCGFTFASQPWLDHNGLQDTTIIMAMICLVANMSFLLLIWKGKRLREWTAKRYTILMQQKDKEDLII
ncbi:membrane transporter [Histoplasma capsulatum G186AR]|uniref:Membrane transporter n=2 Tax=Ajellomyces capsulatus TaxID=5037 RepID=C0NKK6_AJECG|nr:membrane transporter [Histoplasma capsulatum G186AR]EEH08397.1 membrane transporter [Histoplasma capsulatum G186AR]